MATPTWKGICDDVNPATQETALHLAVRLGHHNLVKWLVSTGGATVDQQNWEGDTPLHMAIRVDQLLVAQWLVTEGGSDLHLPNNFQWTPLIYASIHKRLHLVRWFIYKGATVTDPCDSYWHLQGVQGAIAKGRADREWANSLDSTLSDSALDALPCVLRTLVYRYSIP